MDATQEMVRSLPTIKGARFWKYQLPNIFDATFLSPSPFACVSSAIQIVAPQLFRLSLAEDVATGTQYISNLTVNGGVGLPRKH